MDHVESADGTRIAYDRVGSGAPMVCVHGTGASSGPLRFLAASLDAVECAVLDRRGRGESGDADAHSLDREVEDVLAVLDRFETPALYGHSFGGSVALEVARRTDDVDALVLYEPPVLGGEGDQRLAADLADLLAAGDEEAVVRRFFDEAVDEDVDELWPNWREEAPAARTFAREVATVEAYDLPAALSLDVPVLLFYGAESPEHLRRSTLAVADAFPDARLVELAGVGHTGNTTAPDRVATEIESFLRG
jgi:pimeloyl-ACP methyl ester carboxylesterase